MRDSDWQGQIIYGLLGLAMLLVCCAGVCELVAGFASVMSAVSK